MGNFLNAEYIFALLHLGGLYHDASRATFPFDRDFSLASGSSKRKSFQN
jgi:hypothetical protein